MVYFREQLSCPVPPLGSRTKQQLQHSCEELGFSYIEMNATDTRNKKTHRSQSLSNKTMDGFLPGNSVCSFIFTV